MESDWTEPVMMTISTDVTRPGDIREEEFNVTNFMVR